MIDLYNMSNVDQFTDKGYVYVKDAVSKDIVNIVTSYALFDEQANFSLEAGPHPQIHNSHSSYGDPLMESLLMYMHPFMEANTGLTLYPTYSYYRVYRPDAELVIHKDRQSCEISTTVTFNFDYKEQNGKYSWPIFMDGYECHMNPGDLVIYRGCDLDHWREKFVAPEGSFHVQAFLHYVDANGPFAEYKWDRRPSLGYLDPARLTTLQQPQLTSTPKSYITFTK